MDYVFVINNKVVEIKIEKENNEVVFRSLCEGKPFYSCVASRGERLYLLLDKNIVGVGMWSEDQEVLAKMAEEYDKMKGGR